MATLQRHMPVAGQDCVDELLMIAWRFEEKTGALQCQLVEVTEAFSVDQVMHHNSFPMLCFVGLSNVNRQSQMIGNKFHY